MKKFLTSLTLATLCSFVANAQDAATNSAPKNTGVAGTRTAQERIQKKDERQEKYNNASPEQKAKMDQHRAVMEKLSPEKRQAVKAEMDRHRAAMKQITGVDLPMPPMPMDGGQR